MSLAVFELSLFGLEISRQINLATQTASLNDTGRIKLFVPIELFMSNGRIHQHAILIERQVFRVAGIAKIKYVVHAFKNLNAFRIDQVSSEQSGFVRHTRPGPAIGKCFPQQVRAQRFFQLDTLALCFCHRTVAPHKAERVVLSKGFLQ